MRYILDEQGYVELCSETYITCNNNSCTEYTGSIPDGYESLSEWASNSNIRAYKIVDGNLVYDENKDNELQNKYELEAEENACATHKWVNEKLNQTSTIYDDNFSSSTNELLINDSGDYEIPEIIVKGKGSIVEASGSLIEDAKATTLEALNIYGKSEQETEKNVFDGTLAQTTYTGTGAVLVNSATNFNLLKGYTYTFKIKFTSTDVVTTGANRVLGLRVYTSLNTYTGSGVAINYSDLSKGEKEVSFTPEEDYNRFVFVNYADFSSGTLEITSLEIITNTPSPDYPSEIKTIKGIENLFNKDNIETGKYITSDGTEVSIVMWHLSEYMKVVPNEEYTYQGITNAGNAPYSAFYDKDKKFISSFKQKIGINNITIPENAYYIRFSIYKGETLDDTQTFMFEKGTKEHSYVPYGRWLPVKARGKNICPTDISMWESGQYGTNGVKQTNNARARVKDLLPVSQNTYIARCSGYSIIVRTYDKDKKFVRSLGIVSTFTINEDEKYIGVTLGASSSALTFETYQNGFADGTIQPFIYLNSEEDKTFESYKETIIKCDLQGNELCKIGEVEDSIDLVSGVLTKRIGKIVLDGSSDESWNKNASYEQVYYTTTNSINDMLNSNTNAFMSDYYTYYGTISSSASMSKVGIYLWWASNTTYKRVNIKHTEDLSLEEYKAWLSENPITVYYILAEPQTIQLTPNNLELSKGYNYITIEDELEPNIDVTYNSFNTYFEDGLKLQISNDNILINEAINQSINGVDFTINEDKSITIKGKATDNIEFVLNGSMDNIDPIFMLNNKFGINGLSDGINLNLYSYDGTNRELVYSGGSGNVSFEETKYITCSTLSLSSGGNFDITIKPYITTSNEYIEAKLNDLVDMGITKLGEDEHLEIDRSYITLVGKEETILKSIEAQRTFKPNTLILFNSDDLDVTTKYFTSDYINERIAKIEVKQEEIDIEVSKKANAEDITAQLQLKVDRNDNNQIVSMLNASANEINITGNRIAITSDNFQVTKEGTITAKAGKIGGFRLNEWALFCSSTGSTTWEDVGMRALIGQWNGFETDLAFSVHKDNTVPFWVSYGGHLHAEDVDISGTIHSNAGQIAGYNIGMLSLWCSSTGSSIWEDVGYRARIGKWDGTEGCLAFSVHSDEFIPFWVNYKGHLHAEDVDITGTINATSGSIGGSLVTGTISSAGIDIYNGTGFVRALLSNSYHPYVSALNVATQGNFSGGISFRDSKTRTSVGSEMAHISCNQSKAMDIYSLGTVNINHGVNSSGTSIQEGGNVGICALTIESNTIKGSGGGYMYANSNCMFHPATGYHAYINTTDEVNKIMTYGGGAISSRNVKKDLVNIQDDYKNLYEEIRNMNLYTFKYKYEGIKDKEDDFGFIIDELEDTKYISKYINNYDLKGNIVDGKLIPKTDDDVKDEDLHFSYKGWDRDSYLKCLFVMIKSLQNKIDELEEKYEQ
jgi:hypothetical protein